MSESTAQPESSPTQNACHPADTLTAVLSNPLICSSIFSNIPLTSLPPLLTVSRAFFVAAVEVLYKDFRHQHYHKLIKRCGSAERLAIYLGAVRTVDLSDLSRTIQISHWPELLSPFLNAARIKRYTDTLHRSFISDEATEYTFSYTYTERLKPDSEEVPGVRPDIPADWRRVKLINLNAYGEEFGAGDYREHGGRLRKAIVDRMRILDDPIQSLTIHFEVSNCVILDALREVHQMGHGTPETISLQSTDEDLFKIMDLISPTVRNVNVKFDKYEATSLWFDDFLLRTPWAKCKRLERFEFAARRLKLKADPDPHVGQDAYAAYEPEPEPALSFYPANYKPPLPENEYQLFTAFNIHFVYPPNSDIAKNQMKRDHIHLKYLVDALVQITGSQSPSPIKLSSWFPRDSQVDGWSKIALIGMNQRIQRLVREAGEEVGGKEKDHGAGPEAG